ncbi:hypothetical protein LCGC14_2461100, partial [marine sediment metagenome]
MDYKQAVKDQNSLYSELILRWDADVLLRDLDAYIMRGIDNNKIPNIVNVTLNRPKVFYYNVTSALESTSEQVIVESEDEQLDTKYIEDYVKKGFLAANAKLRKERKFKLNPYFDDQACIRGRIAARPLFRIEDGILITDITYWDSHFVRFGTDDKGKQWASFEGERLASDIESEAWAQEIGYKCTGMKATVLDIWHSEGNEVHVDGAKEWEQEHQFGFCPVAIQIVTLGSMLADADSLYKQGESLFFLIRGVIPELNRLVSILQTLNLKTVKPPMKQKKRGGKGASKHDQITAMGANTAMFPDEDISPIDFGDAQRSATIALAMF